MDFLRARGFAHVSGYDAFVPAYNDPRVIGATYDAVVSYDVIEHYEDPRECMRSLANLLAPGGILVVGTPRADGVSTARKSAPQLHPPYHRHILSERVLLALGREQGMKAMRVYRRSYADSLVPFVNTRYIARYLQLTGGFMDSAVEERHAGLLLRAPDLLFLAFFGYFLPRGDDCLITFRKN